MLLISYTIVLIDFDDQLGPNVQSQYINIIKNDRKTKNYVDIIFLEALPSRNW